MSGEPCTVGILFGDIAGSTRLYEALGDVAAKTAIDRGIAVMVDVARQHGGHLIKTIGDEVMLAFADPVGLFDCSVEMQRRFDALPPLGSEGTRLGLRVGFHFGPALRTHNDVFGDTVNVAARMVGLAKAGQIIAAAEVGPHLLPRQQGEFRHLDRVAVKGKAELVPIIEVLWQENAQLTMLPASLLARQPAPANDTLRLAYRGTHFVFGARSHAVLIGREAGSHVLVHNVRASRRHATIERRRDSWVLTDHSSNGTYVTFAGERPVELRRQDIVLFRQGVIGLGEIGGEDEVLHFKVEA